MQRLTADLVEAFAGTFLSPLYDDAKPTPPFHREGWKLYCSDIPQAEIIAPREHAKSTAFTHDFILANVLFRVEDYVVLLGNTEEMAAEHLGDISKELHENEDLIREFGIVSYPEDQKMSLVVEMRDGHQFRIIARGSGQKMRGRKWRGMRPGLIVCDDLEDDEQVESRDRRIKFRRWFFRAARPALRDGGRIRVHGTILHSDSLLARLINDKTWEHLYYKAHRSFDDFSEILWPEKFSEKRLRYVRQTFIEQQDPAGYSQEYLNDPFDAEDAYLHKEDFLPMSADDYDSAKIFCAGVDFAISEKEHGNSTSITVGGKDVHNLLHIVDERKGRWGSLAILENLFQIQRKWDIHVWFVEDGAIWKSIAPFIYKEMQARDKFLNLMPCTPTRDKAVRGRSLQRRMRAGAVRFDKEAVWYPEYENELLHFTGHGEAVADDQFDSTAWLSIGFDKLSELGEEDFMSEEDEEMQREDPRANQGRNPVTGY